MQLLKLIFLILIIAAAGVCAYASTLPDDYRYTRSIVVNTAAAKIFPQVNNLQNWNAWSPWAQLDPNAKITYEGPIEGNGAIMRWAGNMKIGEGSMTITSNRPDKSVQYQLDFIKPMKGTSKSEISFEEVNGRSTTVTWSMFGTSTFPEKVISVIMDCEKMMNEQFDKGLLNLKYLVEGNA